MLISKLTHEDRLQKINISDVKKCTEIHKPSIIYGETHSFILYEKSGTRYVIEVGKDNMNNTKIVEKLFIEDKNCQYYVRKYKAEDINSPENILFAAQSAVGRTWAYSSFHNCQHFTMSCMLKDSFQKCVYPIAEDIVKYLNSARIHAASRLFKNEWLIVATCMTSLIWEEEIIKNILDTGTLLLSLM